MLKKDKPIEMEKIQKLVEEYPVIGIINMHNMPGRQLQEIREKLRGKAKIRMSKVSLIRMALEKSNKKNMSVLLGNVKGETALLLTKENPFLIFKFLKDNRAPVAAKIGQTAPKDIPVSKGPTPLPPGPAISSFQKLGLKTTVQGGKIAITQDKVVAKAGDIINADMVGLFSLLKIEPMEVGLDMICAWEKEFVFTKSALDIDVDAILSNVQRAVWESVSLALEIGYITKDTAPLAIARAFREAKQLATRANIISPETIGDIMAKAAREAKSVEEVLDNKKS